MAFNDLQFRSHSYEIISVWFLYQQVSPEHGDIYERFEANGISISFVSVNNMIHTVFIFLNNVDCYWYLNHLCCGNNVLQFISVNVLTLPLTGLILTRSCLNSPPKEKYLKAKGVETCPVRTAKQQLLEGYIKTSSRFKCDARIQFNYFCGL